VAPGERHPISKAASLKAVQVQSPEVAANESGKESLRRFWLPYVVILQQRLHCIAVKRVAATMSSDNQAERELGTAFLPRFDDKGLLTAVVIDSVTREVLMVAFMDEAALAHTRESGLATFFSRSRDRLWTKGESSGHFLRVHEIRVDCDQDAVVLVVQPEGPACHTGAVSCFYRRLEGERLTRITS
jgi:phosphoribosyl-AMP cyclohydrolase